MRYTQEGPGKEKIRQTDSRDIDGIGRYSGGRGVEGGSSRPVTEVLVRRKIETGDIS